MRDERRAGPDQDLHLRPRPRRSVAKGSGDRQHRHPCRLAIPRSPLLPGDAPCRGMCSSDICTHMPEIVMYSLCNYYSPCVPDSYSSPQPTGEAILRTGRSPTLRSMMSPIGFRFVISQDFSTQIVRQHICALHSCIRKSGEFSRV